MSLSAQLSTHDELSLRTDQSKDAVTNLTRRPSSYALRFLMHGSYKHLKEELRADRTFNGDQQQHRRFGSS
jgi:hypothetical protein